MKKTFTIIGLLIVFIFLFIMYSGLFSSIDITEGNVGPYTFIGKEYVGDYRFAGDKLDSITQDLKQREIEFSETYGIYRDNPKKVSANKLRYMVGCIIPDKSNNRIPELERDGYIKQDMGKTHSVIVNFPLKTKLSFIIAVLRVYPALNGYIKEKQYNKVPSLEIYSEDNIQISMEIKK